jgi:hypothetical protein
MGQPNRVKYPFKVRLRSSKFEPYIEENLKWRKFNIVNTDRSRKMDVECGKTWATLNEHFNV